MTPVRWACLVLLLAPLIGFADETTDALDAVAPLADALSNGDAQEFVRSIPENMPGRGELQDNVSALIAQAEVTSSVEVITAEKGSAELDWYLEIRSRETHSVIERRRGPVKIRYRKRGLEMIEPVSFFRPPKA